MASSNSRASIQPRRSTTSSRSSATCAGGPPKPISPRRPHSRRTVGQGHAHERAEATFPSWTSSSSPSRRRRGDPSRRRSTGRSPRGCARARSTTSSGRSTCSAPGSALRTAIESGRPHSMVLYGPPGTGKTTLARMTAEHADAAFEELSAVNAGRPEVREVIARARERRRGGRATIFFLDEIHRFNKAQQDALLPAVEEGLLTLVGATTENPYFEVNSALLSRTQVYELNALERRRRRGAAAPRAGGRRVRRRGRRGRRDRVPRRALGRRRAGRAERARAGLRDRRAHRRGRRPRDGRGRRGRDAAQGGAVRQGRRPALRLHLRLDQVDARLRSRRVALLPRRDARGRRGPALHRAPDDRARLRGHRQRRPAGAAARDRGVAGGRARRLPRMPVRARPGRDLPVARAEVQRREAGDPLRPRPHLRGGLGGRAQPAAVGGLPGGAPHRARRRLREPARRARPRQRPGAHAGGPRGAALLRARTTASRRCASAWRSCAGRAGGSAER